MGTPETVESADGTTIAFERSGNGPALILVRGALNNRSSAGSLAERLAPSFTVYRYDRRGRGSSSDTKPYAVGREIEDLDALITSAGGSAFVYGHSSGGVLALEAAAQGVAITRVVAYEPPFIVDDMRAVPAADLAERLTRLVDAGQRGDAVKLFCSEAIEMPAAAIAGMEASPIWPGLEAVANTLAYDVLLLQPESRIPEVRMALIRVPTLLVAGGASPAWAQKSVEALTAIIPGATHSVLEGQTHAVSDDALLPALEGFLS